ncbi:MAG TPA: hypothetical protein VIY48_04320 [Candidatus Paceibacterota bacterium]
MHHSIAYRAASNAQKLASYTDHIAEELRQTAPASLIDFLKPLVIM